MSEIVDDYYANYYGKVHGGAATGAANAKLQHDLERPHEGKHFDWVLELGAGNLSHISHVQHSFDTYVAGDIRTPQSLEGWHVLKQGEVPSSSGRHFVELDAQTLSFEDASFDRLAATCLLMHLDDPESALRDWRRVVRPGGVLDILIPCDPGAAVRLYRALFSRRRAKKLGFEYFDLVNASDHKRPVGSLLTITRYVFADDDMQIDWFPFGHIPSWNANSHLVLRVRRASPQGHSREWNATQMGSIKSETVAVERSLES